MTYREHRAGPGGQVRQISRGRGEGRGVDMAVRAWGAMDSAAGLAWTSNSQANIH